MYKELKLVGYQRKQKETAIKINNICIGGGTFTVMAGPCAVESLEQMMTIAQQVKKAGANILRGGAYKPRTSPYSFQGLGKKGLEILKIVKEKTGLPVVTEVVSEKDVSTIGDVADILQIGARNMQNFSLLGEVGKQDKAILLKRGIMATIKEFLLSAEYIMARGNHNIILCERGIRTFEETTRFTLDISAVPVIKKLSHLPIIIDPSHSAGFREYVPSLARAAVAVGADGIIIEVHPNPQKALSDGRQSITITKFSKLMKDIRYLAEISKNMT